jgi:tungstate transport system substrate-binding protein
MHSYYGVFSTRYAYKDISPPIGMFRHNEVSRMQKTSSVWIIAFVFVIVVSVAGINILLGTTTREKLVVSVTTSLHDTRLLDTIEDQFEAKYAIDVYFVSAGTGLAMTHAQRGDADMIMVHAPSKELAFLESGYGTCRKIVAYNFFAIVGPEADPANVEGLRPTQALSKIVNAGRSQDAKWISRGDDSGTHNKEKELWTFAGYNWTSLRKEEWYVEAGTGMGKALQVADNLDAYTITDRGTYLSYRKDGIISLKTLVTQGEELLNVYSAIAGNPTEHPHLNFEEAITFIKFLTSEEGQETVASFGKESYRQSLFNPAVNLLKHNTDPTTVQWIIDYAHFDGYECPPEYWNNHPELYT